jgi:Concanavalin A-like lectin/glucanases superfamily
MSITLFLLIPIGLLTIVWSLCFVGCTFPKIGYQTPYSDLILDEQSIIAYWPLNELLQPDATPGPVGTARDLSKQGHDGAYTNPPVYASGMQAVSESAVLNPPSLARGTSIVLGDAGSISNPVPASADFEGGYVSIPWSTQDWPSLTEFTFEAWVQPKWSGSEIIWGVFSAATDTTGFAIYIDATNEWGITIGNGTGLVPLGPTGATIDPSSTSPTYVAVTCQNQIFNIWINPSSDTATPPPANWTSPTPTDYAAADPTQLLHCFIGAGANNQTLRTQGGNPNGAPLYPFEGLIQSVALYSKALDATTLQNHYEAEVVTS